MWFHQQIRRRAGDGFQSFFPPPVDAGQGSQQGQRVGVLRPFIQIINHRFLNDVTSVHHNDSIGQAGDDA